MKQKIKSTIKKVFVNDSKTGKELCPYFLTNKHNLIRTVTFLAHEYPTALIKWSDIN